MTETVQVSSSDNRTMYNIVKSLNMMKGLDHSGFILLNSQATEIKHDLPFKMLPHDKLHSKISICIKSSNNIVKCINYDSCLYINFF